MASAAVPGRPRAGGVPHRCRGFLSATSWPASTDIILIKRTVTYIRPSSRRRTTTSSTSSTA
eukprot:7334826-Prymnesium_polylepis.1